MDLLLRSLGNPQLVTFLLIFSFLKDAWYRTSHAGYMRQFSNWPCISWLMRHTPEFCPHEAQHVEKPAMRSGLCFTFLIDDDAGNQPHLSAVPFPGLLCLFTSFFSMSLDCFLSAGLSIYSRFFIRRLIFKCFPYVCGLTFLHVNCVSHRVEKFHPAPVSSAPFFDCLPC